MRDDATPTITGPDGKPIFSGTDAEFKVASRRMANHLKTSFKSRRPKTKPDQAADAAADRAYGAAAPEIRAFVERVEQLEAEKRIIADGIGEVYAEAKGRGYDVKALRHIVKLRRIDRDDLAEFEAVVDMYRAMLGF